MALVFIVSGTSWSGVATDGSNIKVEAIGGAGGDAGGGGAYAVKSGIAYTSGNTVSGITIGAGGVNSADGTDTKWNTNVVIAIHGDSVSDQNGGAGASCTPSTGAFSGGAGSASGAGGGAAGPNGAGGNASAGTGGTGDNGHGGAGSSSGNGSPGTEWDASHGSGGGGSSLSSSNGGLYGGGAGQGGTGAQGIIVVTYTPAAVGTIIPVPDSGGIFDMAGGMIG